MNILCASDESRIASCHSHKLSNLGSKQASRILAHLLPRRAPPTFQTTSEGMVTCVPNGELVKVFAEALLPQEDCELVAQKFEIDTVKKFVQIFDHDDCQTPFRPQMFDKIPEWERKLDKVGLLRDALKIGTE